MAAYYHGGSEVQAEGLQILHLMNTGFILYLRQTGSSSMPPAVKKTMVASPRYLLPMENKTLDSAHLFAPPHDAVGVLEFLSPPPPRRLLLPLPCAEFVSYQIYKAYCESSLITAAGFEGGSASIRLLVVAARVENLVVLNLHDRG